MKQITFYFDVISPYAYLAFEKLPRALEAISYSVSYRPVLFGAILQHFGQLGPAEISPKRTWTYRQIQWLAKEQSTALDMPANHPFNPLALLRMAVACGNDGASNRYVTERLLRHVWLGGADPTAPNRLAALGAELNPTRSIDAPAVKAELKANTQRAIASGVFGVPTFEVDGQLFWGLDALPMLRAYLLGDEWFAGPQWLSVADLPIGAQRVR